MTKFTKENSPGYLLVSSALGRYIKSSNIEIPERLNEDLELLQSERYHEAETLIKAQLPHRLVVSLKSDR